ncbi:hypothetical protein CAOG_08785 [Capsaspora owczarzaki ATCC 30864]|uniref:Alternative oxidase n=1 Tax=Capsaspora owczarzaki (strain ATCC 30864) TaxID=595528 RepID=A0A0D2VRZ3_CAPO3|nr:hypothetical protein CAOG_08785 [Capsaspora owczarzaki ATCC 30864]KJE93747.1 hypothetical protein CAOG_008785 [Capsaspora owczarzaki ATCC 30864]|eukprot:XP_011270415.1 hypothetical protein CAOG_08785 [Capsaspora owczarzaki ATCC 30864]
MLSRLAPSSASASSAAAIRTSLARIATLAQPSSGSSSSKRFAPIAIRHFAASPRLSTTTTTTTTPVMRSFSTRASASIAMQQQNAQGLDAQSAKGTATDILPPPLQTRTTPVEEEAVHFRISDQVAQAVLQQHAPATAGEKDYLLPHRIWTKEELSQVELTHHKPDNLVDWTAFAAIKCIRLGFDVLSGFAFGERTPDKWLTRIIFLETVAAVPGMVGAMIRHLQSLRLMRRDHGWIHTLLEEAENERMHLLTALQLKQPSQLFRLAVLAVQGVMTNTFFFLYILAPRFVHRFVGYLEEEAVYTYTKCLDDIKTGKLPEWKTGKAPEIAINYWKLDKAATMEDVIYAIRSDEAHHRLVNHTFANLHQLGQSRNPYGPGE